MQAVKEILVTSDLAERRLDKILQSELTNMGLRQCRRLIEKGCVEVNGEKEKSAIRPKAGAVIRINLPENIQESHVHPYLIYEDSKWLFLFKPQQLHSASVTGSFQPSLANWLREHYQPEVRLLQRLDYYTCGIVCAAKSGFVWENFHQWERKGLCHKYYLCLLSGRLSRLVCASCLLDTDNRKKTRCLQKEAPILRHTVFVPLPELQVPENTDATWVMARILCGQRHQIRAHAASLGHPLVNDNLYGTGTGNFWLRHFCLAFPEGKVTWLEDSPGSFPMPAKAESVCRDLEERFSDI